MGNYTLQSLNTVENSSSKRQTILGFSRELLYYCSLKKKIK